MKILGFSFCYTSTMKRLILNADDFCLSPVFNDVITELIKEGTVSSTSVMIDRFDESQRAQVEELKATKAGIGLHVEFTSADSFNEEIQRQYKLFKQVFDQKPSHLDIHKTDYLETGYPAIVQFAKDHNLPFAHHDIGAEDGITTTKQSIGAIHHSLDQIVIWLELFGEDDTGELVLHPGKYDANCKTSLNYERVVDVTKARAVKRYCEANGVEVISFSDLA